MMIFKGKRSKRTVKQTTSAQIVASIDDLLIQILLLLSIKSLTRFESVSKRWRSLITDPEFRLLRCPSPNPALGLLLPYGNFHIYTKLEYAPFSHSTTAPSFKNLKFTGDPSAVKILQSCNGLLLCSSFWGHPVNTKYCIYNPTTKRFTTLPKIHRRLRGMSLAFDPAKSPHYKVLCVHGSNVSGEYRNRIEIYSSDTGSWRLSGEPFAEEANFERGVYWNGSMHWISEWLPGSCLYFNVEDKLLKKMPPLPPIPDGSDWRLNYYFGESCDHLNYIEIDQPQIEFNVYEMKRDYSEWFVKYRVDLSPVADVYPGMIRDCFPPEDWNYSIFCVVHGKEEEDTFLILHLPGKVIRYNLVYKTLELIYEFEGVDRVEDSLYFPSVRAFQYIESLCYVGTNLVAHRVCRIKKPNPKYVHVD